MILNNTQANIFKVNGGIADNFANRPAASGSFYIFYSIDTQEIYYDNGAWVLIGSGGGGVNIYNSNGTLTGNRIVNCINNDLKFRSFNILFFESLNSPNYSAIVQNIVKNQKYGVQTLDHNESLIRIYDNNDYTDVNTLPRMFLTKYKGNDIGLKLDFANSTYQLGTLSGLNTGYIEIQGTSLLQYHNGNVKGIYSEPSSNFYLFGDFNNTNSGTSLSIDDSNIVISTSYGGTQNGFILDYSVDIFQFGKWNGGNTTYLTINDTNQTISTFHNNNNKGLNFQYQAQRYNFGHISNNGTTLQIDNAVSQLTVLCNPVQSGGSSNGIFLDLTNNRNYLFGQFNGGSQTHLRVSDLNAQITTNFSGSINGINLRQSSHTFGFISGTNTNTLRFNSNLTVGFYYNNLLNGLNIQHESTISGLERYDFGKLYGASNTQYKITLTDLSCFLNYKGISTWGLTSTQAEFGFTPGSGSNILLDSSGNINLRQLTQILINGTGITQGTSGSASGQHLKVKINNIDYVIELKNP